MSPSESHSALQHAAVLLKAMKALCQYFASIPKAQGVLLCSGFSAPNVPLVPQKQAANAA